MQILMKIKIVLLIILLISSFTVSSFAQQKKNEFGISIGLLAAGEFYIQETDEFQGTGSGFMVHVFYDRFFGSHFGMGLFFSNARPEINFFEEAANFTEIGLAFKPRFFIAEVIGVKPGLNLGVRAVHESFIDDPILGIGTDLTVEVQYRGFNTLVPFVDLGFISQPYGGNEESVITFSPVFNARFGLAVQF